MPCPLDPIEIMLNVRGEKIQKKYLPSNLFNFVLSFTTGKKGSYLKKTRRILLKKIAYFCIKKGFKNVPHRFLIQKMCARLLFVKERHGNTLTRYECSTI